jgi:hypothetical protein
VNVEAPDTASNYEEDHSRTKPDRFKNLDMEGWFSGKLILVFLILDF